MAHWADITVIHPPAFVKKMQKNAETLRKNYAAEKE